MPLYQYKCPDGHEFEALRSISSRDNAPCPTCGKDSQAQMSTCNWSFGWRLTENSHIKGNKDEFEKNV